MALGPVNILLSMVAGTRQIHHLFSVLHQTDTVGQKTAWLCLLALSLTSSLSAVTGGIIYRPDNTSLLDIALEQDQLPDYKTRVRVHATANTVMVLAALAVLSITGTF